MLRWSTTSWISLYCAIINRVVTNTYKGKPRLRKMLCLVVTPVVRLVYKAKTEGARGIGDRGMTELTSNVHKAVRGEVFLCGQKKADSRNQIGRFQTQKHAINQQKHNTKSYGVKSTKSVLKCKKRVLRN